MQGTPDRVLSEDTQSEALARYEAQGFTGQFGTRDGGRVLCHACRGESLARRVAVQGLHRLEGTSDPSEEAVVAAIVCPRCAAQGTILLPYGPGAPAEDAAVLEALRDARGGQIPQGL